MPDDFDTLALFRALDARRQAEGLGWRRVADQMWQQSAALNAQRDDHPISPATLSGMATRKVTSCQHALFMLRWLGVSPESFVPGAAGGPLDQPLPAAGPDQRLRWSLKSLHAGLDAQRSDRSLTWVQAASEMRCTPSQLTGLRTARYATGMRLAMRITGWLGKPAADFIYPARW